MGMVSIILKKEHWMSKTKKKVKISKKKLTKKELEELALQEQVSDAVEQANSEEIAVDTSSLPHYADASAGASSSTDATLSAPSNETVSSGLSGSSTLWALGGLGIIGIAAAAAGGGGSSSSSSAQAGTSEETDSSTLNNSSITTPSEKRLASATEDDGDNGYWDGTHVFTYDDNGYLDAEVYTNTSNSDKSYSADYINDEYGYVSQIITERSDGTIDTDTYTRDSNHHAIKIEEDHETDGIIDATITIEYDADGNMDTYTETNSFFIGTLDYEDGYLRQETIDFIDASDDIYDEVINYTYKFNSDGKPTEIYMDSNNDNNDEMIIITYDTLGLLSSIQSSFDLETFQYDANGNLIQTESRANGITTYDWEDGATNGSAALIADFINNNGHEIGYITSVFAF